MILLQIYMYKRQYKKSSYPCGSSLLCVACLGSKRNLTDECFIYYCIHCRCCCCDRYSYSIVIWGGWLFINTTVHINWKLVTNTRSRQTSKEKPMSQWFSVSDYSFDWTLKINGVWKWLKFAIFSCITFIMTALKTNMESLKAEPHL